MGCRGRPRRRRARGRRAGGQGTAAPLVDWAASDSEVSSDHDGRDGAGDARRAGSSDGVTPHRQIAQTARPGTDAERIRTPDGTDAGHRYTWGADIPAPEARLHGRGDSRLEAKSARVKRVEYAMPKHTSSGAPKKARWSAEKKSAATKKPHRGQGGPKSTGSFSGPKSSRPASSGSSHVGGREWRAPRDEHRAYDRRDDRGGYQRRDDRADRGFQRREDRPSFDRRDDRGGYQRRDDRPSFDRGGYQRRDDRPS